MIAGVDRQLVAGMFRELVSTWKRAGVDVVAYSDGLDPRPVATVSLILTPGSPPADVADGLGWIRFVTDPDPAPVPELMVSLAATRALVQSAGFGGAPVASWPLGLHEILLARALGRVAAHELGHYLLASRAHTAGGLMRASFKAGDLVLEDPAPFRLEAADRRTLVTRLQAAQFLLAGGTEGRR